MKIAVITEGVSEYKSLPRLYPQIASQSPNIVIQTMKVNVSPDAPPAIIARECKSRLLIAADCGAARAVIVLDRERQVDCSGAIAANIASALTQVGRPQLNVQVVLKDRAFENWLIADLDALIKQPKRFKVTQSTRKRIEPNKADKCDALAILNAATMGDHYDKVPDSQRICQNVAVDKAAANSRSFRHFLHVMEYGAYKQQCRNP